MNKPIQAYDLSELKNAAIYMYKNGKYQELFEISCTALGRPDADHIMKILFTQSLAEVTITGNNELVKIALLKTLQEDGIEYQKLGRAWMAIINLDPFFHPLVDLHNNDDIGNKLWNNLQEVLQSPLFLEGIRKILLDNEFYERILTKLRRYTLLKLLPEGKIKTKNLNYICALAEQCYHNEYAYYLEEDEREKIQSLSNKDPISVAVLACYEPLYKFDIPLKFSPIVPLKRIIEMQVGGYKREEEIKKGLKSLGAIKDEVSKGVQAMYEQNPYPRWRHIDITDPRLNYKGNILVAGCGTGRFLTQIACQFPGTNITAIDISSSSLAYAQRVSEEYKVKNIQFLHCDILDADKLLLDYDFINSSGVLHHMKDPIAGWQKLISKLNPGGVMLIGLYSTKARAVINDAHEYIKENKYEPNLNDIRQFRHDVMNLPLDHSLRRLMTFKDFYSLSDIRDLVFHIQETTYDIPKLQDIWDELDLEFMGFKIRESKIKQLYQKDYPDDPNMMNLKNWDALEHKEPRLFGEMYNFWCRRKEDKSLNPSAQAIFDINL